VADAQLRFTTPVKPARVARLTHRQREVLAMVRWKGSATAQDVRGLGYAHPTAALCRLVERGLVRRKRRGVYEATRHVERRIA